MFIPLPVFEGCSLLFARLWKETFILFIYSLFLNFVCPLTSCPEKYVIIRLLLFSCFTGQFHCMISIGGCFK